jgi:hypothetical protein
MEKTLKRRMIEDMQLRGLSPHTQAGYLMRVTLFARYFKKLPDKLGKEEVKVWAASQTPALSANYRPSKPATLWTSPLSAD